VAWKRAAEEAEEGGEFLSAREIPPN